MSGDLQFGVVGPVEPVPQRNDSDSPVPFGAYNVTEVAVGPVGMRIRPEISLNARIALGGSRFSKIIESWSWTRMLFFRFFLTRIIANDIVIIRFYGRTCVGHS